MAKCDACAIELGMSEMHVVPGATVAEKTAAGFVPSRAGGELGRLAARTGISRAEQWLSAVRQNQHADWAFCPDCHSELASFGDDDRPRRRQLDALPKGWWVFVFVVAAAIAWPAVWQVALNFRQVGFSGFPLHTIALFAAASILAVAASIGLILAAVAVLRDRAWSRLAVLGAAFLLGSELLFMIAELSMGPSFEWPAVGAWILEAPRYSPLIVVRVVLALVALVGGLRRLRRGASGARSAGTA